MNTNPKCVRCGHETYGAGQWCPDHGDQRDSGPVYVSEKADTWPVDGRYPDGRGDVARNLHPKWAEERALPGFEGLV